MKQKLITLNGKEYLLDIEQAKELGILKGVDNRVRSWEEFKEKYRSEYGYFYDVHNDKSIRTLSPISIGDQLTEHEAKALAAFSKLLKLRRDWIGKWEPDWLDGGNKYVIKIWKNDICFGVNDRTNTPLSFPTKQMAIEFIETFRDLIEEAKILI